MKKEKDKKPTWTFHLTDQIAQLKRISLVENIVFWSSQSKYWFYGYKTDTNLNAEIWGEKANLAILISPPNTPRESFPIEFDYPEEVQTEKLSLEQKEQLRQLKSKIKLLEKSLPPPPTKEMELQYWTNLNPQKFTETYMKAAAIWGDPKLEIEAKCHQASTLLIELYELLEKLNLPEELMRDDTQFSIILTKVLQFAETVNSHAEQNGIELPERLGRLIQFTDRLLDRMIEGGNKLFGTEREMTPEEKEAYTALNIESFDQDKSLEERLNILEQLWENPLVDTDDKIELIERAIKWIEEAAPAKSPAIPCPDTELIKRHLATISSYLQKFETEGKEIWQMRIAEAIMDSVKIWREDAGLPSLTQEEFASLILLDYVEIQTTESEDGEISVQMQLYFQDKDDSFDGHSMYASVENEEIKEITLMG